MLSSIQQRTSRLRNSKHCDKQGPNAWDLQAHAGATGHQRAFRSAPRASDLATCEREFNIQHTGHARGEDEAVLARVQRARPVGSRQGQGRGLPECKLNLCWARGW